LRFLYSYNFKFNFIYYVLSKCKFILYNYANYLNTLLVMLYRIFKILSKQKFLFRFIISRIFIKSGLLNSFYFIRNNYKIYFNESSLTLSLWVNKNKRINEEKFICSYIKEGNTVVDVGSNIGNISLPCAQNVGISGKVLAFEPQVKIYNYFIKNIKINNLEKIIKPFNLALGDKKNFLKMTNNSDDTTNQISENGSIGVKIDQLDNFIKDDVHFLKIDVEGYEFEVLKGAENILKKTKYLYFECNPKLLKINNTNEKEICTFLLKKNFKIYDNQNFLLVENIINDEESKKMLFAENMSI